MTALHGSLRFPPSDRRTTPAGCWDWALRSQKTKEEVEEEHKGLLRVIHDSWSLFPSENSIYVEHATQLPS